MCAMSYIIHCSCSVHVNAGALEPPKGSSWAPAFISTLHEYCIAQNLNISQFCQILLKNEFSWIKTNCRGPYTCSFQPHLASVMNLKFCRRNFSWPFSDPQNLHKFSTSKVLGYTVVGAHWLLVNEKHVHCIP